MERAAHEFDETAGDGEAEAGAAEASGGGAIGLDEFFKDPLLHGGGEAGAGVGDRDLEGGLAAGCVIGDGDTNLALIGEFNGVAEEVDEDLMEAEGIAKDPGGDVGADGGLPDESFGAGGGAVGLVNLMEEGGGGEGDPFDGHASGLDFGGIEEVVEDGELEFGGFADGIDVSALFGGEGGIGEEIEHAEDAVHGGADFVADVGEELGFCSIGQFGGLAGAAHATDDVEEGQDEDDKADDESEHEDVAAAGFAQLGHDHLFGAGEEEPAVGGAADGAVFELLLDALPEQVGDGRGLGGRAGGEQLDGIGDDLNPDGDVPAFWGAGEEEGFEEADFEEGGISLSAAKGGHGLMAVGKGDLGCVGIATGGLSPHVRELTNGHLRRVPIGLGRGAMNDGVVVLHPGIAHSVSPAGACADGDERPKIDEAVIERMLGPDGKIKPFELDAFAAGGFGKDVNGVALCTNARDPTLIRGGVVDSDAIDALIGAGYPGAMGEQGEAPDDDDAGQETEGPVTLRHLRGLSAQTQHI